jgi:hypothetical protein
MDLQKFSAFKYQHDGQGSLSTMRRWFIRITLGGAVLSTLFFSPFGCLLFLLPLMAYLTRPKLLYIGPRYLICGETIVYFGNINAVTLDAAAGQLCLSPANARRFMLERDKFPTSARKAHKVKVNQAAKFDKVTAKLIQKVLKASPMVELSGIPDAARQS